LEGISHNAHKPWKEFLVVADNLEGFSTNARKFVEGIVSVSQTSNVFGRIIVGFAKNGGRNFAASANAKHG
jgi:hypothetical protein